MIKNTISGAFYLKSHHSTIVRVFLDNRKDKGIKVRRSMMKVKLSLKI